MKSKITDLDGNTLDQYDQLTQEMTVCQACLPAYMYTLLGASLEKMGVFLKEDVTTLMNRASTRDLEDFDMILINRIGTKIESEGHAILKAGGDNPILLIAALSRMIVKMVDEGVPFKENVILVALAFAEEIKEDASDYGGEDAINLASGKMIKEANARGWFRVGQGVLQNTGIVTAH